MSVSTQSLPGEAGRGMAPRRRKPRLAFATLAAAVSLSGSGAVTAYAADGQSPTSVAQLSNEQLMQRMQMLEDRVRTLENELQQKSAPAAAPAAPPAAVPAPAPAAAATPPAAPPSAAAVVVPPPAPAAAAANKDIFGLAPSPIAGLKIGMYGELKFGTQQNPAANGQWQTGFDTARIVLLPTYQFSDNIIFNSEIEFEHAGTGFDADDKLHGTAEIEQAYVDFKVSPYLNIRSPGIDLVPISYNNLYHEPTLFYSVNRPELANGLIPTTWASPSTSVYGKIVDNLNYQFQVSSSLEDFGDDFATRTDANTVPAGPYAAGIDGINALGFSTPPRGDFKQLSNDLAYTLRLSYTPPIIPGLAGSTSFYFTPNTTPRGAHGDLGNSLGHSSLALIDTEFRYRPPSTRFEFRGEYAQVFFGSPANLRANNDTDPTNNVGRTMYGFSGEVAYHLPIGDHLGSAWELVPFYRYTYENLQTGGFAGTDVNAPTGAGKLQFHTVGAALFPTPQLVLKLNYQKVISNQPGGANADSVLGAVGFLF